MPIPAERHFSSTVSVRERSLLERAARSLSPSSGMSSQLPKKISLGPPKRSMSRRIVTDETPSSVVSQTQYLSCATDLSPFRSLSQRAVSHIRIDAATAALSDSLPGVMGMMIVSPHRASSSSDRPWPSFPTASAAAD